MKQQANEGVLAWLAEANEDNVFLSMVTITELRYRVERLAAGKRRLLLPIHPKSIGYTMTQSPFSRCRLFNPNVTQCQGRIF
jgi:hypothetical protein